MKNFVLTAIASVISLSAYAGASDIGSATQRACDRIKTESEYYARLGQVSDSYETKIGQMAKEYAIATVAADSVTLNSADKAEAAAISMELLRDIQQMDRYKYQDIQRIKNCAKSSGIMN